MSGKDDQRHRLEQRREAEALAREGVTGGARMREFGEVEELLRADRAEVTVPPGVAGRVAEATRSASTVRGSWWSRWFSRGGSGQQG